MGNDGFMNDRPCCPAAAGASRQDPAGTIASPVMAEVWRGSAVESFHRGRAVVADAGGRVVACWGDAEAPVYPRSAIKAIQALPLLETGAFYSFGLEAPELALACGSHHGEPRQIRMVQSWLERIGCTPADLACGPQPPFDEDSAADLIRAGTPASALHNNCSGKHAGMLTTARHCREPIQGYSRPDHPVQQRIRAALAEMTGCDLTAAPCGTDGCGVPTIGLPLRGLAVAMARLAAPQDLAPARAGAAERVREAWARYATLIGGRTSFDTRLMQAIRGAVLVKSGGEGVAAALLPRQQLGVAVKIDDGTPRAKNVALMAVLHHLGVFDAGRWQGLSDFWAPAVTNWAGAVVGSIRPAPGWTK